MDDDAGASSQGYYLEPCDSGLRDSKRYVESPVHSPSSEVPNAVGEGEGTRYADKVESRANLSTPSQWTLGTLRTNQSSKQVHVTSFKRGKTGPIDSV